MADDRPTGDDVAKDLTRSLHVVLYLTVLLYVLFTILVVIIWLDSSAQRHAIKEETQRTTHALCTFRGDLVRRIRASNEFLRINPRGIPGVPNVMFRNSISNQQQAVDALGGLPCR